MLKRMMALLTALMLTTSIFAYAADDLSSATIQTAYASSDVLSSLDRQDTKLAATLQKHNIHIDPSTVMPLYEGSLLEYGNNGVWSLTPSANDGMACYVADAFDESNTFAGVLQFYMNDDDAKLSFFSPRTDFPSDPAKNISLFQKMLSAYSLNQASLSIKLAFIEGLGYTYVLSDGEETLLTSASVKAPRTSELLSDTDFQTFSTSANTSVLMVDDTLREIGAAMQEESDEYQAYLATLDEDENPPTGNVYLS